MNEDEARCAQLMQALHDGHYPAANGQLVEMELMLAELTDNGCEFSLANGWSPDTFYTVYMIVLLLVNDLNSAKYLWKRAAEREKKASEHANFSNIWEVGKSMWKEEIVLANAVLTTTPWVPSPDGVVADLVSKLQKSLLIRQIRTIAKCYKVVKLDFLAQQLFCTTPEEALNYVEQLHWTYDAATSSVMPSAFPEANAQAAALQKDCTEQLAQMSRLVAFFETKALHAEKDAPTV